MKDNKFQRGQIWLLKGEEAHNTVGRPVLIISPDFLSNSPQSDILVIPCTSKLQKLNFLGAVKYTTYEGRESIILPSSIMSVPKHKLTYYLSTLDSELMARVEQGLAQLFQIKTGDNYTQIPSQEPKTFSQEPKFLSQEPKTFSQEPQPKSPPPTISTFLNSPKPLTPRTKLTPQEREEFLTIYTTQGPQVCADHYHITKAQAASRAHTYRKSLVTPLEQKLKDLGK